MVVFVVLEIGISDEQSEEEEMPAEGKGLLGGAR